MTLEEQIRAYKELSNKIAELEGQKKELSAAILGQMTQKKVHIAGYTVTRYDRLSIKLSIEDARQFGATKMTEVLDRAKIKELYQSGQSLPGVSSWSGLQVLAPKQPEEASHHYD